MTQMQRALTTTTTTTYTQPTTSTLTTVCLKVWDCIDTTKAQQWASLPSAKARAGCLHGPPCACVLSLFPRSVRDLKNRQKRHSKPTTKRKATSGASPARPNDVRCDGAFVATSQEGDKVARGPRRDVGPPWMDDVDPHENECDGRSSRLAHKMLEHGIKATSIYKANQSERSLVNIVMVGGLWE